MILLVEPNPLRSRLHWLALVADVFPEARLVIPRGAEHEHMTELLPAARLRDAVTYFPSRDPQTFSLISTDEIEHIIACLTRETEPGDTIILMALDEMVGALSRTAISLRRRLSERRLLGVRYRPSSGVRRVAERTTWRRHGLSIGVLDERTRLVTPYDAWLPDPSVHKPTSLVKRESWTRLVLIGRQDPRKGLGPSLSALGKLLSTFDDVSVHVQGKLSADVVRPFDKLMEAHAGQVTLNESFISEKEIARLMTDSDICLLPYDRSFTGSSGVLSLAAAFKLPVLATSHGLVGHRVIKYELGTTFTFGSDESMVEAYAQLRMAPRETLGFPRYAMDFSRESFDARIRSWVEKRERR